VYSVSSRCGTEYARVLSRLGRIYSGVFVSSRCETRVCWDFLLPTWAILILAYSVSSGILSMLGFLLSYLDRSETEISKAVMV